MMMSNDIGIDLGTASILVYIKGKGVVLKEPSVVAIDRDKNEIKAIGEEARLMIGRTPGNIVAVRPLRQGVISDYTVTEKMLKYFINKAVGKRTLRKPRVSVCIPSGATEVDIASTISFLLWSFTMWAISLRGFRIPVVVSQCTTATWVISEL